MPSRRLLPPVLLPITAVMMLTGCCGDGPDSDRDIQLDVSAKNAVMAADREFAADVAAAEGADRAGVWAGWFAREGRQILPGRVVAGRAAIEEFMTPFFDDPEASLTWTPDQGGADGDRGWTSGRYVSRSGGAVSEGRYLTVWVNIEGNWLVDVDTGVPDPDPLPAPAPETAD